jgi:hypothetical protein
MFHYRFAFGLNSLQTADSMVVDVVFEFGVDPSLSACRYLIVATAGYFVFGDVTLSPILGNLPTEGPQGTVVQVVKLLVAVSVLCSYPILMNVRTILLHLHRATSPLEPTVAMLVGPPVAFQLPHLPLATRPLLAAQVLQKLQRRVIESPPLAVPVA